MRNFSCALLLLAYAGAALAQSSGDRVLVQRAALLAPCVNQAAAYHRVNPTVLLAIGLHESRGNPSVVVANTNNTIDVGAFGINSVHFDSLKKHGVAPGHLLDPCIAAYVAAWHYRTKVDKHGNTWAAIGAYHSETPVHSSKYQQRIYQMILKIQSFDKLTTNK
jgi:lysozyme-related protein Hpa2